MSEPRVVYTLTDNAGQVFYVGQTRWPEKRLRSHQDKFGREIQLAIVESGLPTLSVAVEGRFYKAGASMNIDLLEDVKAEIRANPGCFSYSSWEHCIAGITCRLSGLRKAKGSECSVFFPGKGRMAYGDAAQALLGLSDEESNALFVSWPLRFAFKSLFSSAGSAKAAVARINAFIREKGYTPREHQRLPKRDPFGVPTFALL